jgi:hypothetical protein
MMEGSGSITLTNGSGSERSKTKTYGSGCGSGPRYYECGSGRPKKIQIRMRIRIIGTSHLHHSSKIKSHKEVTKQKESKFSLLFLLDDGRIRIHNSD